MKKLIKLLKRAVIVTSIIGFAIISSYLIQRDSCVDYGFNPECYLGIFELKDFDRDLIIQNSRRMNIDSIDMYSINAFFFQHLNLKGPYEDLVLGRVNVFQRYVIKECVTIKDLNPNIIILYGVWGIVSYADVRYENISANVMPCPGERV